LEGQTFFDILNNIPLLNVEYAISKKEVYFSEAMFPQPEKRMAAKEHKERQKGRA
jgi:hypothetical protein